MQTEKKSQGIEKESTAEFLTLSSACAILAHSVSYSECGTTKLPWNEGEKEEEEKVGGGGGTKG